MCGNWGLLCLAELAARAQKNGETFPKGLEDMLRQILVVVEMRGAQAGGVLAMFGSLHKSGVEAIRVRALKPKRGNLCHEVFRKLAWEMTKRNLWHPFKCLRKSCGSVLVQGHSRFGTSSAPAVLETHPHQWTPTVKTHVWVDDPKQGFVRRLIPLTLTITHNGDFDAWKPYRDTMVGVGSLGLWLDRILGVPHRAQGDSPKIAGVMELLACQGVWLHAVRLAYHLHIAVHVEQATGWNPLEPHAPSRVPDRATMQAWADVFDAEFAEVVKSWNKETSWHPLDPENFLLEVFMSSVIDRLESKPVVTSLHRWVAKGKVKNFVAATIDAFRDNDLLAATTAFLRHAQGTFGVTVTSTAFPDTVVLAAKGQPMSIGFGGLSESSSPAIASWTSEPASLGSVSGAGGIRARLDLDDQFGELVQLRIKQGKGFECVGSPAEAGSAGGLPSGVEFRVQLTDCPADDREHLEAIGIHFGRQQASEDVWTPVLLTADAFRGRLTWLTTDQGPDNVEESFSKKADSGTGADDMSERLLGKDLVKYDLKTIPALLNEIDLCWSDKASLNCESGTHFADVLLSRFRAPAAAVAESASAAKPVDPAVKPVDLLVIGIENSLWLAQQFVADLTLLFPSLRAVALSSNVALGLVQSGPGQMHPYNFVYGKDSFHIAPTTVGLVLSHSGTTYPTVWAARFLHKRTPNVFGISSSFDCLLAASIGQAPGQSFTRRLFSTMAGIRPAEAATAATVAMQHTLSHLLLQCAAWATKTKLPSLQTHDRLSIVRGHAESPSQDTIDVEEGDNATCTASGEAVKDMHRVLLTLYLSACRSVGVSGTGEPLKAKFRAEHERLRRTGRKWSHHITEGYWATFIPAAYVLITVTGGIPPVTSLGGLALESLEASDELKDGLIWLWRFLDSLIYIFLGIIVAMTHRVGTGRRLWARFTTRTLLVVECTVNYKLLRAYASKLLALSWRFATLSVVGQNGTDHFVHEFTHKAQSDVLVALGRPDGRLHTSASAEASILMSVQQAKFIKRAGKGIEVCSLGHNPWTRKGLCGEVITLPTLRPEFAGEKVLMREEIVSAGYGVHGLPPGEVLQRWSDLLVQNLDPMGMPGIRLSMEALGKLIDTSKQIPFAESCRLLEKLIEEQRVQAQAESVPLNLRSFLAKYILEHPSRTMVVVHSPGKAYVNPSNPVRATADADGNADWGRGISGSSARGFDRGTSNISGISGRGEAVLSPERQLLSVGKEGMTNDFDQESFKRALSKSILQSTAVRVSSGGGQHDSRPSHNSSGLSEEASKHASLTSDREKLARLGTQSLEPDEFLAMLHGSELQKWLRNMRHRWAMIRQIKGLLVCFAEESKFHKMKAMTAVLAGGITISQVFSAWKKLVPKDVSPAKRSTIPALMSPTKVQDACLDEVGRRKRRGSMEALPNNTDFEWDPAEDGLPIGQYLINQELSDTALLDSLRTTEIFYEARVASTDRLISWFVLLHAMAEPSSRLPFLRYELGKSESRLRVASTPAPIPVHACDFAEADAEAETVPLAQPESMPSLQEETLKEMSQASL